MRTVLCFVVFWSLAIILQAQPKVSFSPTGGVFQQPCAVTLSFPDDSCEIHYTLNGNTPTVYDALYDGPLTLSESLYSTSDIYTLNLHSPLEEDDRPANVRHAIVIRAAAFDTDGHLVSTVATQSYFVKSLEGDTHGLPVLSLCADSLALFDYGTGIMVPGVFFDPDCPKTTGNYYQTGKEWERLCNVECYANDTCYFNMKAGLRTHGEQSRRFSQKGLKIYARKEYGEKRFFFPLFETTDHTGFKHLVLKPFSASWFQSGVEDYLCDRMAAEINVESSANQPVVLFLNGEYWGIYLLKEKIDEDFLSDHFDVDEDDCTIVKNWTGTVDCGDNTNFNAMMSWLSEANLADSSEYAYLCSLIDVQNFIDYVVFETFIKNADWPSNNMRCWQENDNPWRWIFFDGDACLSDLDFDAFANAAYTGEDTWPSSRTATLLFRKLLENKAFISRFLARYHELTTGVFSFGNTTLLLQQARAWIRDEVIHQSERFGKPASLESWETVMEKIRHFLETRPSIAYQELCAFLSSPDSEVKHLCCFPNPSSGAVYLSFQSESSGLFPMRVYNSVGQLVVDHKITVSKGDNMILTTLNLPMGIYFIKIYNEYSYIIIK